MVGEKNSGNIFVLKYTSGQFVKQSVPFVTIPNLQTGFEDNGVLEWPLSKLGKHQLVYFGLTKPYQELCRPSRRYHATTASSEI